MIRLWIIATLFTGLSISLLAQEYTFSTSNKKAIKYYNIAEQAFRQRDNDAAADALENAVAKDDQFVEAWLLLGDAYTELKQVEKAIGAYEKAVQIDPSFFPATWLFLGELSLMAGNYDASISYYEKYLQFPETSESSRNTAQEGLNKAKFSQEAINNPSVAEFQNAGKSINSPEDEYINFVNESESELIFTRKQWTDTDNIGRKLYVESFFSSIRAEGNWQNPEQVPLTWSTGLNLGGMNITVDGKKMYFTGCNWPEGFGSCDLYTAFKEGDEWTSPVNLGTIVNSQWWDSQPAVSSDGKRLYFASKRVGGKGGSDIWMSLRLKNGKWSPPINLGDSINTSGNEMSPFLHADGSTLYFSSDGHIGLGGSDLFLSKKDETGRWSKAKNLGYPINSKNNEVNSFVSLDGTSAWISSNREGGFGGFDIYVFETEGAIKPSKIYFVKGIVKDAETGELLSAGIELTDLMTGNVLDSTNSDALNGSFLMVLHPGIDYAFNISHPGYLFYSENFDLKETTEFEFVDKVFELSPLKEGNSIVLNNIFFDFDSAGLRSESMAELDRLVKIMMDNQTLIVEISGHTDDVGAQEYNKKLSADRAYSVANYLINNGIESKRLMHTGFGESMPIATNNTAEGRNINRRTEFKVLSK